MDYGRTQTFCLTHFTRLKGIIPKFIIPLAEAIQYNANFAASPI